MKEIQLQIDIQTLKIYRENFRQIFKKKFDWTNRYYFEIFVGSYRFVSAVFHLQQPVFNPKVVLNATLYQGKYMDLWLREFGKDDVIAYGKLEAKKFRKDLAAEAKDGKNELDLEMKFNDMTVATISSNLEVVKSDLYKEKPRDENLDDIFGDGRKHVDLKAHDHGKKEEEKVEYKQESAIKVTNKFKVGKPLI